MSDAKIAVQLDFDGTVTVEDVSYLLLETYGDTSWRRHLEDYNEAKISVGVFNRRVFSRVKADQQTMTQFVLSRRESKPRAGLKEFLNYCRGLAYKIIIVSNGLRFYIDAILWNSGIEGMEIHAAENEFSPEGMKVWYLGPDGNETEDGFKEAYTRDLRAQGFDIIYIGDGSSDIYPARLADRIFATGDLRTLCRREGLPHTEFKDFFDITRALRTS